MKMTRSRSGPSIGPPLRARKDDIAILATHFLKKSASKLGVHPPRLTRENLVTSIPRRGYFVRELSISELNDLIAAQLMPRHHGADHVYRGQW